MATAAIAPEVRRSQRESANIAEMQRRRLLLSICEVVAEGGSENATVGRICAQAGVSRRTFYELFVDRQACLLAALEDAIERIGAHVADAYRGEGSWRERIRRAVVALLEQLDLDPDRAHLCIVEAVRGDSEVLARRRQLLSALASAVDEGRGEARASSQPPPLTADGVVGGALSVIHDCLLDRRSGGSEGALATTPLVELTGPLVGMIVHPYLGAAAARREIGRPTPVSEPRVTRAGADPFRDLSIRFTYRTAQVLRTIASAPGTSNRQVGESAGIVDEGQTSRLLRRLEQSGLIANRNPGHTRGEANAWELTERGETIHTTITAGAVVG